MSLRRPKEASANANLSVPTGSNNLAQERESSGSSSSEMDARDPVDDIEMELDFHIQFPTPEYIGEGDGDGNGNNNAATSSAIWPKSSEEDKEVLVILLGWAGSQHKTLSKYSDIYLKRGCIVLRYITPVKALFIQTQKLPVLAKRLVRLIQDMQLESHPIFFHVLSNGGSFMYSAILRELYKVRKTVKLDIRGSIFDSAPSPRNLGKAFLAVKNIFGGSGVYPILIASLVVLSMIVQVFWMHFKSAVTLCLYGEQLSGVDPSRYQVEEVPLKNWMGRLCKMKNHNYLFLYSDNDDLIPWKEVEEFSEIAADQEGNRVVRKKFLGSVHVQHYRQHPEEYIDSVVDFVQSSMKGGKSSTILWDGC